MRMRCRRAVCILIAEDPNGTEKVEDLVKDFVNNCLTATFSVVVVVRGETRGGGSVDRSSLSRRQVTRVRGTVEILEICIFPTVDTYTTYLMVYLLCVCGMSCVTGKNRKQDKELCPPQISWKTDPQHGLLQPHRAVISKGGGAPLIISPKRKDKISNNHLCFLPSALSSSL
ncbi:hypothetical protein VNO77_16799 [Canavalia gladiata]|uniref:Uncharacterized protein n=1 Tax=Canavalia gladiata TaxID=3824 RepID=A0AAN9LMN9_CANGL